MRKRLVIVTLFFLVLSLLLTHVCFAESSVNFEEIFNEMSLEELQALYDSMGRIINEKRIGSAVLIVEPSAPQLAVEKTQKLTVSSDGRTINAKTTITYESSNPKVAKVSSTGMITAVSAGKTAIKVTAVFDDGGVLEATAQVTVYIPVTSIKVPLEKVTGFVGLETDLNEVISVNPANATEKKLLYSVSDETIATVSEDGKLKGLRGGNVTVTVTSAEKTQQPKTAKINVKINQAVSAISLNKTSFNVGKGKTVKLEAKVSPSDATNQNVTWTSSDPKIATVLANGTVTGVKTGTVTITCTAKDGSGTSASAKATVITAVNSIQMTKKTIAVIKGKTAYIDYTMLPNDASNKKINWTSSNTGVATVSASGIVTGVREGSCTITAAAADGSGISASVKVYVEPTVPVEVDSIHWQTVWGQKSGKMGVYGTNLCSYLKIKSFDCTIVCSSWFGNSATTSFSYSGEVIAPGKEKKSKLSSYSVGGFTNAITVEVTVTSVTFEDGTEYVIPSKERVTSTFSP